MQKKIAKIILFALCLIFIIFSFFIIRYFIIIDNKPDSLSAFYNNPAYQEDLLLLNFPVYKQGYSNSCGPATISMIYSYLAEPVTEQEFADAMGLTLGKSGMLPSGFYQLLQRSLEDSGYRVEHLVNVPDNVFLENIYLNLKLGIPVPVYFSTINYFDKPDYDTHYSVIIGLSQGKRKVTIANAYGYQEEIEISDLLSFVKFNNFNKAPFKFKTGLFFGVINRTNLFKIRKK